MTKVALVDLTHRMLAPIRRLGYHTPDYNLTRAYVLGWSVIAFHHLFVAAIGIVGFVIAPAPVIVEVIGGHTVELLWSSVFTLFGTIAFIARIARKARAEVVAVLSIAVARLLWSGILIYSIAIQATPIGSLQITLLMVSGAVFLIGWSITVMVWISGSPLPVHIRHTNVVIEELRDHLKAAANDINGTHEG